MPKPFNLVGRKFSRLAVIELTGRKRKSDGQRFWKCRCDCGSFCEVETHNLSRGTARSCGCLQRERTAEASLKHGLRRRGYYNPRYYQFQRRDPLWRLKKNVSCMIWKVLKHRKGGQSILPFLPFTFPQLVAHIEQQFEPWMSWSNYGEWHLDHIKPRNSFTYTKMTDLEFRECWSLSNLRPLKAVDNRRKASKVTLPLTPGRSTSEIIKRMRK